MYASKFCLMLLRSPYTRLPQKFGAVQSVFPKRLSTSAHRFQAENCQVVDIDIEAMMDENSDYMGNTSSEPVAAQTITSTNIDGVPLAPIDVDPWVMEDDDDMEMVLDKEPENKPIEYPPIPTNRLGRYEFKGIKIRLPQDLLHPGTYRYRLEPEDQETLADDIRVCKFRKLEK